MKWKKDHKLPNTKSKLPDTLPAATTSSPNLIKKEEHDYNPMMINGFIKEESLTSDSSNQKLSQINLKSRKNDKLISFDVFVRQKEKKTRVFVNKTNGVTFKI